MSLMMLDTVDFPMPNTWNTTTKKHHGRAYIECKQLALSWAPLGDTWYPSVHTMGQGCWISGRQRPS
jgi:hypothetical protein